MKSDTAIETKPEGAVVQQRLVRLSDVEPRKNAAFSPNLYYWLRKHRSMRGRADRYECEGIPYIGFIDDDFFIGSRLWQVLCNGGRVLTWAYPKIGKAAIHYPLWDDYLLRGRCAIDPDHKHSFIGDRWVEEGDTRTCQWCGLIQRRETFKVVETRERWVSEPNAKDQARR